MFIGKRIVVGICGGIAAYKTAELIRYFKKNNAEVNVIMTENSLKFITSLTMQTLSNNPVNKDMFEETKEWDIKHISLGEKADLIVVAPATANIIGKIANGIADDMLSTTIMASKSKVLFVPAMNTRMYENPIVQENIKKLKKHGYLFQEAEKGEMACGTFGNGRFPVLAEIEATIENILLGRKSILNNKKLIITAGPTRESLDSVRFFTNASTGKMGFAIALEAKKRGAEVLLVSGPVSTVMPDGIQCIKVINAEEMYGVVKEKYSEMDIAIFTAAVADYRPLNKINGKLKKNKENLVLEMIKNHDIAYEMSKLKKNQINIGFCAETENLIDNAKEKLINKKFDLIIGNDITKEGAGFEVDTNIITIINDKGVVKEYSKMSKNDLAVIIIDEIENVINNKEHT